MPSVLGEEGFGLEHIITETNDMTGVLPIKDYPETTTVRGGTQDDAVPVVEEARGTLTVGPPDSDGSATETGAIPTLVDGNGLFDPYSVFTGLRGKHVWITAIEVRYSDGGAGKNWAAYVTSGLEDGTQPDGTYPGPAAEVDTVGYDVELESGTANDERKLGYELFPGRKVRVIADNPGAGQVLRVAVFFTLVNGPAGRLIS